jgi:hypothetical protein
LAQRRRLNRDRRGSGEVPLKKQAARRPEKKWGPALLPAPTAPSEGYAGVRNLVDRTRRPTNPLSILAHQLRRRFPSDRSLLRGAQPIYSSCDPEDHRSFDLSGLTRKSKPSDVLRPFLGRSLLRPASLPAIRRPLETASRLRKIDSSGASSRLAPHRFRRSSALPAGGDRTFGHLPLPRAVAGSWGGRDRRPDHPCTMHSRSESGKRKIWEQACG